MRKPEINVANVAKRENYPLADLAEARRIARELVKLHRDGAIKSERDASFYATLVRDFGATYAKEQGAGIREQGAGIWKQGAREDSMSGGSARTGRKHSSTHLKKRNRNDTTPRPQPDYQLHLNLLLWRTQIPRSTVVFVLLGTAPWHSRRRIHPKSEGTRQGNTHRE